MEINGEKPCRSNAFPIYKDSPTDKEIERRLRGVNPCAKHYIKSIQPYKNDHAGTGKGLQLLNDMCNIDKHRHLVVTIVRWTGYWPKVVAGANFPLPSMDSTAPLWTLGEQATAAQPARGRSTPSTPHAHPSEPHRCEIRRR